MSPRPAIHRLSFVAALMALGVAGTVVARDGAPQVTVRGGTLVGKAATVDGVTLQEFQGIPYAAPPLGPLRWKPPQPLAAWQGEPARWAAGQRALARRVALNVAAVQGRYSRGLEASYQVSARPVSA